MKILFFIVMFSGFSAHSETSGFFPANDKAVVVLENGGTTDADFFWQILAVQPQVRGPLQTKKLISTSRDFVVICNRDESGGRVFTNCTLNFYQLPGGNIAISVEDSLVVAHFREDFGKFFRLPANDVRSPDGTLTICRACGSSSGPFSITWKQ